MDGGLKLKNSPSMKCHTILLSHILYVTFISHISYSFIVIVPTRSKIKQYKNDHDVATKSTHHVHKSCCRIATNFNLAKKKSDIVLDTVNVKSKVVGDDTSSSIATTPAADRKVKKKKKPSPKKTKSTIQPNYWHDINDPFIILANDQIHTSGILSTKEDTKGEPITLRDQLYQHDINLNSKRSIKFTIRGNPRVLIRHRTARGFVYNPSKAAQENFKDCLLKLLPRRYHPTILDDDDDDDSKDDTSPPTVLFTSQDFLKLTIIFKMKRPKSHFISNKPGPNRLKSNSPSKYYNNRSDIDNLTKFVMDSLNGVIYVDDKQVVQLEVLKVLDNDGECLGATEVMISVLDCAVS